MTSVVDDLQRCYPEFPLGFLELPLNFPAYAPLPARPVKILPAKLPMPWPVLLHAIVLALRCGAGATATGAIISTNTAAAAEPEMARDAAPEVVLAAPRPSWVQAWAVLPTPTGAAPFSLLLNDIQAMADGGAVYVRRAYAVQGADGLATVARSVIPLWQGAHRVLLHGVRHIRAGLASDWLAQAVVSTQAEAGRMVLILEHRGLQVGDTLDIEYTLAGGAPSAGSRFALDEPWDLAAPVSQHRILVNAPEAQPVLYQLLGAQAGQSARRAGAPVLSELRSHGRRILALESSTPVPARAAPVTTPASASTLPPDDEPEVRWVRLLGGARSVAADVDLAEAEAAALETGLPELERQLHAALAGLTRTIMEADRTGRDSADALCERARVLAYLNRPTDAQADAARAAALQPSSARMVLCRADAYFSAAAWREAERDYAQALAMGAVPTSAHLGHGLSAFYQGKGLQAAADFELAALAAGDAAERLRARILARLAAPALNFGARAIAQREREEAPWLASALDMLSGRGAPERMLALAAGHGGRGMNARLAEAYFYAGQYYKLTGDADKAFASFRRGLDKQVFNGAYHQLLQFELSTAPQ